jgi:hypothetical protein
MSQLLPYLLKNYKKTPVPDRLQPEGSTGAEDASARQLGKVAVGNVGEGHVSSVGNNPPENVRGESGTRREVSVVQQHALAGTLRLPSIEDMLRTQQERFERIRQMCVRSSVTPKCNRLMVRVWKYDLFLALRS